MDDEEVIVAGSIAFNQFGLVTRPLRFSEMVIAGLERRI